MEKIDEKIVMLDEWKKEQLGENRSMASKTFDVNRKLKEKIADARIFFSSENE